MRFHERCTEHMVVHEIRRLIRCIAGPSVKYEPRAAQSRQVWSALISCPGGQNGLTSHYDTRSHWASIQLPNPAVVISVGH